MSPLVEAVRSSVKMMVGRASAGEGGKVALKRTMVCGVAEAEAGLLVGDDGGAGGVDPGVAVGVVVVPVGVDEVLDGVGADGGEGFGDLGGEVEMPVSTRSLPCGPGRTAMLPPEPMRTLTLPRSFCVVILAVAAVLRALTTMSGAGPAGRRGSVG